MTGHLAFLGAAFAAVWLVIFVYVWNLSRTARSLSDRLERLERVAGRKEAR